MSEKWDDPIERIDLSSLDPGADAARLERLMAQVRVAATPELMRRASIARSRVEGLGLLDLCLRWRRSILAASALLAFAATVTLVSVKVTTTTQSSLAEALGVPSEWTSWLRTSADALPADAGGVHEESAR